MPLSIAVLQSFEAHLALNLHDRSHTGSQSVLSPSYSYGELQLHRILLECCRHLYKFLVMTFCWTEEATAATVYLNVDIVMHM